MLLSKDEAICLVLGLSQNKKITTITKLNKLLARLNLFLIPIDIDFRLNKFGSFNSELGELNTNELYEIQRYTINNSEHKSCKLKENGEYVFNKVKKRMQEIFTDEEFTELKKEINFLSQLSASDLSEKEHEILLVDKDERFKLEQRLNDNYISLMDLYDEIDKIKEDSIISIKLKALIEYCYYLMKYLKERRFKSIPEEYEFDAFMFDYYFLAILQKYIIPFLVKQITEKDINTVKINRYYQYIVNYPKGRYPFSIDNENLNQIIQ